MDIKSRTRAIVLATTLTASLALPPPALAEPATATCRGPTITTTSRDGTSTTIISRRPDRTPEFLAHHETLASFRSISDPDERLNAVRHYYYRTALACMDRGIFNEMTTDEVCHNTYRGLMTMAGAQWDFRSSSRRDSPRLVAASRLTSPSGKIREREADMRAFEELSDPEAGIDPRFRALSLPVLEKEGCTLVKTLPASRRSSTGQASGLDALLDCPGAQVFVHEQDGTILPAGQSQSSSLPDFRRNVPVPFGHASSQHFRDDFGHIQNKLDYIDAHRIIHMTVQFDQEDSLKARDLGFFAVRAISEAAALEAHPEASPG